MSDEHEIVRQIFEAVIPYPGIIKGRQSVGLQDILIIDRCKAFGYDFGCLPCPQFSAMQYLVNSHIVPVKMGPSLSDAADPIFRERPSRIILLLFCLGMLNEINNQVAPFLLISLFCCGKKDTVLKLSIPEKFLLSSLFFAR